MAKTVNANEVDVSSDAVAPAAEAAVTTAAPAKRSRKTVKKDATVAEKIESAQAQVYTTFRNLTNGYITVGARSLPPQGVLKLHRAQGEALAQSPMIKNLVQLKRITVK